MKNIFILNKKIKYLSIFIVILISFQCFTNKSLAQIGPPKCNAFIPAQCSGSFLKYTHEGDEIIELSPNNQKHHIYFKLYYAKKSCPIQKSEEIYITGFEIELNSTPFPNINSDFLMKLIANIIKDRYVNSYFNLPPFQDKRTETFYFSPCWKAFKCVYSNPGASATSYYNDCKVIVLPCSEIPCCRFTLLLEKCAQEENCVGKYVVLCSKDATKKFPIGSEDNDPDDNYYDNPIDYDEEYMPDVTLDDLCSSCGDYTRFARIGGSMNYDCQLVLDCDQLSAEFKCWD